jgi:integrase
LLLQELGPRHLTKLYSDLLKGGSRTKGPLKPKTVRNVHLTLRRALADAVRWGNVARNSADQVPGVPRQMTTRQRQQAMRVWSADQLRSFLSHVRDDRLYALWLLLGTTGMWRAEALGLMWDAVDFEAGTITIRRTVTIVNAQPYLSTPKTDTSTRTIALDPQSLHVLREHRKRQLEERLAWGEAYSDARLVFARENGAMMNPERISTGFKSLPKDAGLPPLSVHGLRHTYATASLKAGIPAKVVSSRLGHSSIALTLDLYSHVLPETDQDAADRVAVLILGG